MNSLRREIEAGEVVVIDAEHLNEAYKELPAYDRAFRTNGGGFGTSNKTTGSALYGEWLLDGDETRQEGYQINPEETEEYQEEYGKKGEKDERTEQSRAFREIYNAVYYRQIPDDVRRQWAEMFEAGEATDKMKAALGILKTIQYLSSNLIGLSHALKHAYICIETLMEIDNAEDD